MSKLDDIKSSFGRKLDEITEQHAERLAAELKVLRQALLREVKPATPQEVAHRLKDFDYELRERLKNQEPPETRQALVDMRASTQLRELDAAFAQTFDLARYYPTYRLSYPTVYCETLEEFFTPILEHLDISPQARQIALERAVEEAIEIAERTDGGGTFGVNLPGKGCYLNGWLFVYGREMPPEAALQDRELLPRILGVSAHEKLGHGFLSAYSALGEVKSRLGLEQTRIAEKFGLRGADDPTSSLRMAQDRLLYLSSQLLEEGWSTWVETYLTAEALGFGEHPRYSLEGVRQAVEGLLRLDAQSECGALLQSLDLLFGPDDPPLFALHQAVMVVAMVGDDFDEYFGAKLGQPLRYAVGELVLSQAEANLGALCAPYASLVAGNVTFDPAQISLSDLDTLLSGDPRLHPDARLAAISRLRLAAPNNVKELAERAQTELSFSVPPELKR
jgi:hypothetical protein